MKYYLNQFTPKEYLIHKGIPFKEANGEMQFQCPFNSECMSSHHKGHCYMNIETGQYQCKKCGEIIYPKN